MSCKLKEPINGLTHCIGAILAVVALILLIYESVNPFKPWHVVTFSVFGTGMFLLYTASTLYHWLPVQPKVEKMLQKLDHCMIFVLIASTYTPVCLIPLRGAWGWSLFGIIWGLTFFGILMKIFWNNLPMWFTITFYIFMGWISMIFIWPLIQTLQFGAIVWILIGGIFYTVGTILYSLGRKKPAFKIIGSHEIFHIFVMMGSFFHFWVMYNYLTLLD
tara:strand:- start:6398 stop:7051 length:654 start_codon:yes stop_codon:yes gene_type:complete